MITYGNAITPEEYMSLREKVGWSTFPLAQAEAGIAHTYMILCARDEGKAIGVVRLLWDRGYIAYLSDVIVDPAYQRQGIGKNLVQSCLRRIRDDIQPGYRVKVSLMAAQGKEPFYGQFSFITRPNEHAGAGMEQWITLDA